MKGKSILFSLISFAIAMIAIYSTVLSGTLVTWLGAASLVLTAFLSTFMKTGELPKEWTVAMWASNIALVIIMFLDYTSENGLIPPAIATLIGATINAFINTFLKDYGNGSRLNPR